MNDKEKDPVIEQRMTLHLNCGQDGHRYCYDILVDGKETSVGRITASKRGVRTMDKLICGDEEFDVMGAKPGSAKEFILDRVEASDD